jgi:hypothetical protein
MQGEPKLQIQRIEQSDHDSLMQFLPKLPAPIFWCTDSSKRCAHHQDCNCGYKQDSHHGSDEESENDTNNQNRGDDRSKKQPSKEDFQAADRCWTRMQSGTS